MLPEIDQPSRWTFGGVRNLAVPSEEFDKIDVLHIDDTGGIYAREIMGELPKTINGLLDAWLNVAKNGGVTFVPALDSFRLPRR